MSRQERTRRVEVDLCQIWVYVAERNYPAADALLERLERSIRLLADHPEMGESIDSTAAGLRRFTVDKYVLYFRPISAGIRLIRVVHGSREMREIIDSIEEDEI